MPGKFTEIWRKQEGKRGGKLAVERRVGDKPDEHEEQCRHYEFGHALNALAQPPADNECTADDESGVRAIRRTGSASSESNLAALFEFSAKPPLAVNATA
ncbi:MAG: hypothetical protein U5K38_04190 [Woeseiaceae bacterium]|nr:hypothetical protein [Woeseiaceae bacterium]